MIVVLRPELPDADVVGLEHRDVRDAVPRREVVRRRQAVAAAADDHDVVGRARLVPADQRDAASRRTRSPQPLHRARRVRRRRPAAACRSPADRADLRRHAGDGALGERRRRRAAASRRGGASSAAASAVEPGAREAGVGYDDGVGSATVDATSRRAPAASSGASRSDDRRPRRPSVSASSAAGRRDDAQRRRSGSGASTDALRVVERRSAHDAPRARRSRRRPGTASRRRPAEHHAVAEQRRRTSSPVTLPTHSPPSTRSARPRPAPGRPS